MQFEEVLANLRRVCEQAKQREAQLLKEVEDGLNRENELLAVISQRKRDRKLMTKLKRGFQAVLRELEQADEEPKDEAGPEQEESAIPAEPFPDSPFAETRRRLNEALAEMITKKFTGKRSREDMTIACSSVKWSGIEAIYKRRLSLDNSAFPVKDRYSLAS